MLVNEVALNSCTTVKNGSCEAMGAVLCYNKPLEEEHSADGTGDEVYKRLPK